MAFDAGLAKILALFNIQMDRWDPTHLPPWRAEADGLRIGGTGADSQWLSWADVEELVTFKRDLGNTDQICLGLRRAGADNYLVLEEDNPTWVEALSAIDSHFQLATGWLEQVAHPPYACNWRILWGKPLIPGK